MHVCIHRCYNSGGKYINNNEDMILICRIREWGLTSLRSLRIQCNHLCLGANWNLGVRLREVKLCCKSLHIDPNWIPEDTFSVAISLGPLMAAELDGNSSVELMKSWTGMKIEYIPVESKGDTQIDVRASREKHIWLAEWESALERNCSTCSLAAPWALDLLSCDLQSTPQGWDLSDLHETVSKRGISAERLFTFLQTSHIRKCSAAQTLRS